MSNRKRSINQKFKALDARLRNVETLLTDARSWMLALERRIRLIESAPTIDQSIFAIVEDLRARMPKGSAVSDYRHNELAGTVARLERALGEIKAAWENAKRNAAEADDWNRRQNLAVRRVESKALPE